MKNRGPSERQSEATEEELENQRALNTMVLCNTRVGSRTSNTRTGTSAVSSSAKEIGTKMANLAAVMKFLLVPSRR